MKIAIDAGHGRDKQGKRSPEDFGKPVLFEYVVTRQLARTIETNLTEQGIECMATYKQGDTTTSARIKLALGSDLLLSLHTGSKPGLSIGVFHNHRTGKKLAEEWASRWKVLFPIDVEIRTDEDPIAKYGPHSCIPTLMFYVGDLSSWADLTNLRSEPYKRALAQAIADAATFVLSQKGA